MAMDFSTMQFGGISTITGTVNQVLVNGLAGTPSSGPIVLTTPQDIGTTSSPQFGRMGLGESANLNSILNINGSALTAGTVLNVYYPFPPSITPTGAITIAAFDGDLGIAASAFAVVGVRIEIGPTSNAASYGLRVDSEQDGGIGTYISVAPVTANSPVDGLLVAVGANASSASRVAAFTYASAAGTITGSGIVEINASGNLTGKLVGIENDLTGVTPNAVAIIGQRILLPAGTRADNALEAGLVIDSQMTLARIVDMAVANTGQATALIGLRWRSSTTWAATMNGLVLDFNTNVTGGSQALQAFTITSPAAITNASWLAKFDWRGTAGTAVGNGIVNIEVGSATTLTDQLVGMEMDLATNVTPGSNAVTGLFITIPATTRAAATKEGALVLDSRATQQRIIDMKVRNEAGPRLVNLAWDAAATLTGQIDAVHLDLLTNVTAGSQTVRGLYINMPATSSTSSYAIDIDSTQTGSATAGINIEMSPGSSANVRGIRSVLGSNSSGIGIYSFTSGTGGALAGEVTGGSGTNTYALLAINRSGQPQTGGGSSPYVGSVATFRRGESGSTPVQGNESTHMIVVERLIDNNVTNPTYSGHMMFFNNAPISTLSGTTTLSGSIIFINHVPTISSFGGFVDTTTAININMDPWNAQNVTGVKILMTNDCTGRAMDLDVQRGSCQAIDIDHTTETGAFSGATVSIDTSGTWSGGGAPSQNILYVNHGRTISTGTPSNTFALVRFSNALAYNGGTYTNSGSVVNIDDRSTLGGGTLTDSGYVLTVQRTVARTTGTLNLSGSTVLWVNHAPTGTVNTNTETGFLVTMTPPASAAVKGMLVRMDANVSNAGYAATFDWRSAVGTAAGNGIVNIEVGASTSLSGQLVGLEIDLTTNVTANAVAVIGQRILIPATTRANTAGEGAFVVVSDAVNARCLDLDVANETGIINTVRYGSATTLSGVGTLIGWDIDLSTNVTANSQQIYGVQIKIPANAASTSVGFQIYTLNSNTRAVKVFTKNTLGSIIDVAYDSATTLTSDINAINLDLNSSVTPGANYVNALTAIIPATTRANTAGQGIIRISSDATRMRMLDLDVANTGGSIANIYYGGGATLASELTGMFLDFNTNVTLNSQKSTGLRIDMAANTERAISFGGTTVGVHYGTGSPETVVTADVGSLYVRTDGGAGTTLYVKESGTGNTGWAAK